ncbi:hypothetical protein [Chitinimonas sp.]|uniref:hypothetical protein n=1 Tax=Chitinimonas sp. TaxID=1934313 RepID=UPI0035B462A0
MRPFLRHLLILLLAIALPVMGWAGVVLPAAQPCPMQATVQAGDHADCCADKAAHGKVDSPCKMGQQCPSGVQAQPVVAVSVAPVLNTSPRVAGTPSFFATAGPTGVWRPPILA